MKKMIKVSLIVLLSFFILTSCVNWDTCYFVSGKYQSTDRDIDNDTNTIYYLEVEDISYDKYIESDGVNVVKDVVLKENYYFSIKFYKYADDNNQEIINLINMKEDSTTSAPGISYIDDNGIEIFPYYPDRIERYSYSPSSSSRSSYYCYYSIYYETEYLSFERIE